MVLSSKKGNHWGDNIGAWCQCREKNSGQTNHPETEHGWWVLRGAVPWPRLPRGQWGHILHVRLISLFPYVWIFVKIKILACVRHVSKGVLNVEVKATIIVMSCAFTLMCKVFIVQVSIAC